jgi:hypothetical protein
MEKPQAKPLRVQPGEDCHEICTADLRRAGVGVSMALPTAATAALSAVPPADLGKASGVNGTLRQFGGAFGIATAAAVFAAHGHLGSAVSFTAGFRPALVVAAGFSLLGAITALAVGRPARPPMGGAQAPAAPAAATVNS